MGGFFSSQQVEQFPQEFLPLLRALTEGAEEQVGAEVEPGEEQVISSIFGAAPAVEQFLMGLLNPLQNTYVESVEQELAKRRDEALGRLRSSAQLHGGLSGSRARQLEQELESDFLRQAGQLRFGAMESGLQRGLAAVPVGLQFGAGLAGLGGLPREVRRTGFESASGLLGGLTKIPPPAYAPSPFAQMLGGLGGLLGPLVQAGVIRF